MEELIHRIGGFYELTELLQWPPTQVSNRLRRERQRSDIWTPGDLPRPFMRIKATPLWDLDEVRSFVRSPAYYKHGTYVICQ